MDSDLRPAAVSKRLQSGEKLPILDVREDDEVRVSRLNDTINIPMSQLQARVGELDAYKEGPLVVMCKVGGRSSRCADFLRAQGFKGVINMDGGISAWSDEVDSSIPKY
ncbi:MAG TPA: rhodanese-like domain-containing protein [Oculatellaceae cyanobacterium]